MSTQQISNIDLDSFTESDRKFVLDLVDVFSAVKGKDLDIYFEHGSGKHFIYYDPHKDGYCINTDPTDKRIDWKTAIEHELSHFIFDTAMKSFKYHENRILKNTEVELKPIAKKLLANTYNALEDQRIESWFGKIKTGSRNRFYKTRTNLGNDPAALQIGIPKDPINALLLSRFNKTDIVNQSAFKEANDFIKEAEFLDPKGSIVLTKKYYDEIVYPFIKKQKEDHDKRKQQQQNKQGNQNGQQTKPDQKGHDPNKTDLENQLDQGKQLSELTENDIKELNELRDKDPKKFKELIKQASENKQNQKSKGNKNQSQTQTQPDNIFDDLEKELDKIPESDHKDFDEVTIIDIDLDDLKKALEKSKEQGQRDLKKLLDKLTELKKKGSDEFTRAIKRDFDIEDLTDSLPNNKFKIDHPLANKLSEVFRQIKAKRKIKMDISGSNISIPMYVNAKHNSNVRVFKNERKEKGLTVYVLCDQSSSMGGNQIEVCTNILATFYKSVEAFRDVKIIARGFSGNSDNLLTCRIDNIRNVGKMNNDQSMTPTDLGLIESKKDLDKINGKKFLIVITDGDPNSMPVQDPYRYINWIIEDQFRKNNIGVFGILIGSNEPLMKAMFNSDYAVCNDLTKAKQTMTKVFEKTVRDYLA